MNKWMRLLPPILEAAIYYLDQWSLIKNIPEI